MAAKGIVALLMKKAPPPGKIGSGVEDGGDPADEGEGGGEHDDADGAALESAVADFFEAGKAGKFGEAARAYREMHDLCGDAEPDSDDSGY